MKAEGTSHLQGSNKTKQNVWQ